MARLPSPKAGRFCSHGRNKLEGYEYRGTMLIIGRELIQVHRRFKRAMVRSRYKHNGFVLDAGAKVEEQSDETPPRRAQKP
jgi:hypothetical protein